MIDLSGRTALVTGGSGGIGAAIAARLAASGAAVIIAARNIEKLTTTAQALAASGAMVEALQLDVADAAACGRLTERLQADCGGPDILVNCAGTIARGTLEQVHGFPILAGFPSSANNAIPSSSDDGGRDGTCLQPGFA